MHEGTGVSAAVTPQGAGAPGAPGIAGRVIQVDALRGFALAGIVLVNALIMAGPYGDLGPPGADGADRIVLGLVGAFVATKFYLLFSFLFGYSFTLQTESAQRAGAAVGPRVLRRLAGLFVLGLVHAVVLFSGDILMTYAVLGLILLAARGASPRGATRAAAALYGTVAALLLLAGLALGLSGPVDPPVSAAEAARLTEAYRGGPADILGANLDALPTLLAALPLVGGFVTAAFLLGLAAGKRRSLHAPQGPEARRRLRRLCLAGYAVGLPGAALSAAGVLGSQRDPWTTAYGLAGMVLAPALCVAYATTLLLWFTAPSGLRVARALAPAGRMSLTNYLLQSLVLALLFTGYGSALYARTGPATVVAAALTLYAAQLALSVQLMRRHRYGPVEWLLRAVTLARRP